MMNNAVNQIGEGILKANTLLMDCSLRTVPQELIDNWFTHKELFFILSIGRSGSMFLADLLNRADTSRVRHEPTRLDFLAHISAFCGRDIQYDYISEYRKNFIYLKNHAAQFTQYGEVNSLLRRHPEAIKRNFPKVKVFYLVRDGRDVVRSMMARRTFTARDPFSLAIRPRRGDDYYEQWSGMDRFERLCWYWWVENQYLNEKVGNPLRFERMISDYEYIKDNLLAPLGMDLSRETWQHAIERPKNTTSQHAIAHWEKWNSERKDQFDRICGSLMESLGYYGR